MVNVEYIDGMNVKTVYRRVWNVVTNLDAGSRYIIGKGANVGTSFNLYSGVDGEMVSDNVVYADTTATIYEKSIHKSVYTGDSLNGMAVYMTGTGGSGIMPVTIKRAIELYVIVDGKISYEINPFSLAESKDMFKMYINGVEFPIANNGHYLVREGSNSWDGSETVGWGFMLGKDSFELKIEVKPGFGYVAKTTTYQIAPGLNHLVFDMNAVTYSLLSAPMPMRITKMVERKK